jgi:hypothetical protein
MCMNVGGPDWTGHNPHYYNNNSTIYRNYFGYSKTWPENTYHPEGTLPTPWFADTLDKQ